MRRSLLARAVPLALLALLLLPAAAMADGGALKLADAGKLTDQTGINSTWVIVAGWPILTDDAWFCGTLARAMIFEMSITVTSGEPGDAISPA